MSLHYLVKCQCLKSNNWKQDASWCFCGTHGSVATHLRCGGIFSESVLQIFSWFWHWKNFENRLIFDEVKAYKNGSNFLDHPVCLRWKASSQAMVGTEGRHGSCLVILPLQLLISSWFVVTVKPRRAPGLCLYQRKLRKPWKLTFSITPLSFDTSSPRSREHPHKSYIARKYSHCATSSSL